MGKKLTHNLDRGSSVTMQKMHTHTHTHTVQTDKVKVAMSFGQIAIFQKFVFYYSYRPFI